MFQSKAHCFLLAIALQVFSLVLKCVHRRGVWMLHYLDDWLIIMESVVYLQEHPEPRDCHQCGEIRPQADQQGSVSEWWKHHMRKGLSDGLSDYQIAKYGGQVLLSSISTYEDVGADSLPLGLSGIICFQRWARGHHNRSKEIHSKSLQEELAQILTLVSWKEYATRHQIAKLFLYL